MTAYNSDLENTIARKQGSDKIKQVKEKWLTKHWRVIEEYQENGSFNVHKNIKQNNTC